MQIDSRARCANYAGRAGKIYCGLGILFLLFRARKKYREQLPVFCEKSAQRIPKIWWALTIKLILGSYFFPPMGYPTVN